MNVLVVLLLCFHQYIPLEGLQLAPYLPSLAPPSERAKFLQEAAAQGDAALIGFIHKSDPLAWESGDAWRRVHGTTALHAAAESSNGFAVRALIALGANVSTVDDQHRTPLHITARADGALAATIELLAAGAEVDATTLSGVTPLMEAVLHGASNTFAVLLHAGADRGKAPDGGFSVAVQALQKRDPQIYGRILGASPVYASEYYNYPCRGDDPHFQSVYLGSTKWNSTDSLFRTSLHHTCDLLT
ncbi:Transient receptor potential channel pyrexia [Gryllus bimaculatus]|nr:Transient receptor potential channel pyrexia [Gryllus bimaculatus]